MEALAQGTTPPPRFLMCHWPVGTIRHHFLPVGSGTNFTFSRILTPFEPLKSDTIVLYGLTDAGVSEGMGGGHEAGTPMTTTGANCPGTRHNGGEADDASAGGPSWDQILLKNVPALQRPSGPGYVNAICDARVDAQETSTQCLSYGYTKRSILAARPAGTMISEAIPLLPELSPTQLYLKLFSGFMPGGGTPGNAEALLRGLHGNKSVFDYCMSELRELRLLAPAAEYAKLDEHIAACQKAEVQVVAQINAPMMPGTGCMMPTAPSMTLIGKRGSKDDYGNPIVDVADDVLHAQIAKAHASLILAAFQCDLIRVATLQFSPGTNHVSFAGLMPDDARTYMHHPQSHKINSAAVANGPPPTVEATLKNFEFLANVHRWYNQLMADILTTFKSAQDVYGASVLDHTVVPFVTEVAETAHTRSPKPALIFGGSKLGMRGGQYHNFQNQVRPHNDLWATVAQAYFKNTSPIQTNLSAETFVKTNVAPIPGLWAPPAA